MVLYTNPNYNVVVSVSCGSRAYRVLEKLGFKNEFELAIEEREKKKKEVAKEFFDKCKKKKEEHKKYLKQVKEQTEK